MRVAYLGLGSNLGDRLATLQGARQALAQAPGVNLRASSALYETAPVGGPEQGPYLNAVLEVETDLAPPALLELCLEVEQRFGRRRTAHWGPRTCDIDLLLCGALMLEEPQLILPHPRLHQRRFVLAPLAELAPQLRHPLLGRTVTTLLDALGDDQQIRRLETRW